MALTDNLKWQIDVNSRARADNEFYNHVGAALMTKNSSPAVNTDQLFGAMDFDGVDDYFTQSFPAGLSATFLDSDFTIAVRFLVDPDSGAIKKPLLIGNTGGTQRVDIGVGDTDLIGGAFDAPSGTDEFETSAVDAGDGKAHVVVWRRSGNNFTLWVDGVKTNDVTTAVSSMGTMNQINVGRRGGTNATQWYFPGIIYWAAIWDNDISDGDLATLHTSINPFLTEEDGDYYFGTAGATLHFPPTNAAAGDQIIMKLTAGTALLVPTQADIVPEVMPATFSVWAWDVSALTLLSRPDITVYIGQNRIVDTFTDTNGTALPDHTPDIDESTLGWAYAAENDTVAVPSSGVTIEGNKLRITAGGAGSVIETESTNQQVSVDIVVDATTQIHTIQFNWQDSANRLSLKITAADGTFQLNQRHLGVAYPGFGNGTYDLSALGSFTIDIASVDGAIDVYCEDTLVISAAVPPRALATNATKVGLFSVNQSGTYPIEYENFAANAEVPAEITLQTSGEAYNVKPPVVWNRMRWASMFGNALYSKQQCSTVVSSTVMNPDGKPAWKMIPSVAGSYAIYRYDFSLAEIPGSTPISFAIDIYAGEFTSADISFYDRAGNYGSTGVFNASTGAWTSAANGSALGSATRRFEAITGGYRIYLENMSTGVGSSTPNVRINTYHGSGTMAGSNGCYFSRLQMDLLASLVDVPFIDTEHVPLRSDQVIVRAQGPHNPLPYSATFSNSAWQKTNLVLGDSLTFGGDTYNKIKENSATGAQFVLESLNLALNPALLTSVRFRFTSALRHAWVQVYGDTTSNHSYIAINPSTGAILFSAVVGTAAIHSSSAVELGTTTVDGVAGTKVWEVTFRLWPSTTSAALLNRLRFRSHNGSTDTHNGDGTSGIYLARIQICSGYDIPDYAETTSADPLFADVVDEVTVDGVTALIAGDNHFPQSRATNANGWGIGSNTTRVANGNLADDTYPGASSYIGNASGSNIYLNYNFSNLATGNWTVVCKARIVTGPKPTSGTILSCDYHNGTSVVRATVPISGSLLDGEWREFSVTFNNQVAGSRTMYFGADTNSLCEIAFADVQIGPYSAVTDHTPTLTAAVHVRDRSSAIVTLPPLTDFTDTGDHVNTGWMRNLPVVVEGLATGTIRVEPADVATNFGNLGPLESAVYPPAGLVEGDEVYGVVDEGEGTFDPVTCDFTVTSGPLSGTIYGYAVEAGAWVTPRTVTGLEAPAAAPVEIIATEMPGRAYGRLRGR